VLEAPGVTFEGGERSSLEVHGLTTEQIGDAAAAHGIAIHELTPQQASLEEAFMTLTRSSVEFGSPVDGKTPEEAAA
jgi:ABC-2 type transport system ATP-binding protein